MSYSFERKMLLKVGEIFYECSSGENLKAEVITEPVVTGEPGDRELRWQARNVVTEEVIEYMTSEKYQHYGARLYSDPQYICSKEGEYWYPLFGGGEEGRTKWNAE